MAPFSLSISQFLGLCRRALVRESGPRPNPVNNEASKVQPLDTPDVDSPFITHESSNAVENVTGGLIDIGPGYTHQTIEKVERPFSDRPVFPPKTLPREVLEAIFLLAVDFQSRALHLSCRLESDTARYVSQVSREWRYAALHSAKVWEQALDPDSNTFMWLVVVLKRCNFRPLALVSSPRPNPSLVDLAKWTLLREVYPFCRYIYVELTQGPDVRCIRWLLSIPSQHLLDATVVWDSKDLQRGWPPTMTVRSQPLFGNNAPTLRQLHLLNCPTSPGPMLFPSLQRLRIETLPGHSRGVFKLLSIQCLCLLQTLGGLVHLDLSHGIKDDILRGVPNLTNATRVRLLRLQSLTYRGNAAVFGALYDRLDIPLECTKHVFHDFTLIHRWSQKTTDELIAGSLALIPILGFESLGLSVLQKRIYISFGYRAGPAQYEVSFDVRDYVGNPLPQPTFVRDTLKERPDLERHDVIDYFVCAVRSWILQHPRLLGDIAAFRYVSAGYGVSTLAMLPLLWMCPRLASFHIADGETLANPLVIDTLRRPQRTRFDTLILPFYSLMGIRHPSDDQDLGLFKQALKSHAPASPLASVQHIQVTVSPMLLKHCGPAAYDIVQRAVEEFESMLSFRKVSWVVMDTDEMKHFTYPPYRTLLARDLTGV